ncbi:NADH-quinone oxidoreductase subunit NuoE [Halorhodospira halophila]|uniref:NADH-quinone oxidoreductase subunit E n=1 Tax=Halorhodospira halophila (strain DSM 244 / SL1) TaxID=349124 RepID=A1WXW3_HALHL|nr:NADH dehydrogenase subunit E [Halorhodospira halophila SL1]MBK1728202.1 NAD(P)H-dependent oxidoreductase subunit E [Halorhodospira halophila]
MTERTVEAEILNADQRRRIDHWLAKYPDDEQGRASAIIPALHILQDDNGGWLERSHVAAAADYIGMPRASAFEVATFYSMFHLDEPVGRHKVNFCTNISCCLNGADELVAYAEEKLGIRLGETTPDGRITLVREEECLAACTRAPMMVVDGHYYTHLTRERIDEILDGLS